jgi:TetR/AcrR family transcriptional regulator, repressor for neighboring sulfatase
MAWMRRTRVKQAKKQGRESGEQPRRDSEKTKERILDVAEKLFARGGLESVTVRDIAAKAGVSHALVHRYFGSKQDVYRAVIVRYQDRILRAAADATDLPAALSAMVSELLGPQRDYGVVISHAAIHGAVWDAGFQGFAVRHLLELGRAESEQGSESPHILDLDYRFVLAAVVTMALGWISLESWAVEAAGLQDIDEELIKSGIVAMAMRMLGSEG